MSCTTSHWTVAIPSVIFRRRPWPRLVVLVVAGVALLLPIEWVVHAAAGTTETRAVVVQTEVEERSGRGGNIYTAVAVTADGQGIDLQAAGAGVPLSELPAGSPVIITRSTADGQILEVRSPRETIRVENSIGMIILRVLSLGVAVVGLWLGLLGTNRHRAGSVLTVAAGLLVCYLVVLPDHDLGPYPASLGSYVWRIPDAMAGYSDPPTAEEVDAFSRRVNTIVPIGTAVSLEYRHRATVTGPPEPGLPPGADPAVAAGFGTLRVPVLAEPGPNAGAFGSNGGSLPNMELIGTGRGTVTELWESPTCGGAPEGVPSYFTPPLRGYVCFVVPDDFVPRYLVFANADVAVDLRAQPVPASPR